MGPFPPPPPPSILRVKCGGIHKQQNHSSSWTRKVDHTVFQEQFLCPFGRWCIYLNNFFFWNIEAIPLFFVVVVFFFFFNFLITFFLYFFTIFFFLGNLKFSLNCKYENLRTLLFYYFYFYNLVRGKNLSYFMVLKEKKKWIMTFLNMF